ncbi:MAG: M48 family metallopeptidase [Acidimicrobiia bacterium]|nr:M48 family metallopeptidase [Acidimicrobiia bacterium]
MQMALPLVAADDASAEPLQLHFVRHRRARRYVVRVDRDGLVRVTVPRGGSTRDAEAFARRHVEWIERERARVRSAAMPGDEVARWRRLARKVLPARLLALAGLHGLTVARVSIRNQRSRWGSCGRDGHVTLNWRLVLMPDWVSEYVLIHELMHLKRLDHSPAYWRLVAACCPGYRDARRWLRTHGRQLG